MSGLAGRFFTEGRRSAGVEWTQLARSFAGPNYAPVTYADADVELFVASRFISGERSASCGELIESDRYVLAVEGYIANLADLVHRETLDGRASRGEVLLALFERHGTSIFEQLNGGYNLIVWNKTERVATVGTCKFGQRTLYSSPTGDGITFASDLHALRRISGNAFELDPHTACMSFLYGGVYGSATPLRNVRKVLPGSVLTVRRGAITSRLASDIAHPDRAPVRRDKAFYVDGLDNVMRQAASRLARVGNAHAVMVGSGVDSSLVAAYAKGEIEHLSALTQQMPGEADESSEAARIVRALGIPQTVLRYDPQAGDLLEQVAAFVRVAEEPAYWNQLGPALLHLLRSFEERPASFLTGAEGDFLFNFRSDERASVTQVLKDGLFWPVATYTTRRLINRVTRHTYIVGSDFDLLDRGFMRQHIAADCTAYPGETGFFDPPYHHLATGPNAQRHFINNGWQNVRIISQFGRDAGAEVLFPYLDDDVVSCILSLPDELKINKGALRILLARFLPQSIVPSKKKGYWAHTIRWHYEADRLKGVLDIMSERRTMERGVYHPPTLRATIDAYARKMVTPHFHPALWQLLVFEIFCRQFVDGLETGI